MISEMNIWLLGISKKLCYIILMNPKIKIRRKVYMKNLSKLYPLTVALGLIFLNFNFFNQYESLRAAGKILIVISIILFFVKYFSSNK